MSVAGWDRIEPLLGRLLELEEEAREGFLQRECADEPELARRLEELLARELAPDPFLTRPDPVQPADPRGQLVGRYRLLRPLGHGGMGEVWLAERADGEFEQRVALKLIHGGLRTEELLRRFRAERQILAWLEHPGIARLVDGGVSQDGRPYLVMEYVDGEPIVSYVESRALPVRARLELFLAVCDAVQHAHERGVVHRDLKPGNVLVDAAGQPKLLDFGIAKVLGAEDATEQVELTRTGQRLFSPLYASPEQVRGEPVTAASDVYSLGVLLCELLTGQRPYDARTTSQLELERVVCETRPRLPSELAPASERSALRGDLDWIVGMSLRKEPDRRYANVEALALDVRRHLAHETVLARPDSLSYRARTFARRNRALVGGTLAVFVALTAGLVVSLGAWRSATDSELRSRRTTYSSALQAAEAALREGDVAAAEAQLAGTSADLRGWEYRHLVSRLDRSLLRIEAQGWLKHDSIAVHPDGATWALRSDELYLYDTASGERRTQRSIPIVPRDGESHFADWSSLVFHPDGELIAMAARDGIVRLLDARTLEVRNEVDLVRRHVYAVAYDPEGRLLACGLRTGEIAVLAHPGYEVLARWQAHDEGDLELAFSADGSRLASGAWDERIRIWSVSGFEPVAELTGHERHVTDLAFAQGDELLVSTSIDGTARVWPLDAPEHPLIVRPHAASVESLALHPDGETVFTGGGDGTIVRWELRSGEVVATLRGHRDKVQSLALLGGDRLVSTGGDSDLRIWSLATDDVRVLEGCEYQSILALHPRDTELSVTGPDGRVWRWSLPDLVPLSKLVRTSSGTGPLGYDAQGGRLFASGDDGSFELWDLATRERAITGPSPASFPLACWIDVERERVCYLGSDGTLEFHSWSGRDAPDPVALDRVERVSSHGQLPLGYVDGRGHYWLGINSGEVWRIDPQAGSVEAAFQAGSGALVLAGRGEDLLVGSSSGVSLHRAGSPVWRREDLGERPRSGALHPEESRVAIGMRSGVVQLLDARTGELVASLRGHTGTVEGLEFSQDGSTLYSCSKDGTVRVWTAPPMERLPVLAGPGAAGD